MKTDNQKMTDTLTKTEALIAAGLNWTVSTQPIYDNLGREITSARAIMRDDTKEVFKVVSNRYEVFQNSTLLDVIDRFLESGGAKYAGLAGYKNGRQIIGRAYIPEADFNVLPGDNCRAYLGFSTSHDGGGSIQILPMIYRMVCKNGMHRWTEDRARMISVRHTKSAADKLEFDARTILNEEIQKFKLYAQQLRELAQKEFKECQLESFLHDLFEMEEGEEMSTRTNNQAREIAWLVKKGTGQDLPGVSGTKWAVLNGVTEFIQHKRGTDSTREYNALFGTGRELRERAYSLLTSDKF